MVPLHHVRREVPIEKLDHALPHTDKLYAEGVDDYELSANRDHSTRQERKHLLRHAKQHGAGAKRDKGKRKANEIEEEPAQEPAREPDGRQSHADSSTGRQGSTDLDI